MFVVIRNDCVEKIVCFIPGNNIIDFNASEKIIAINERKKSHYNDVLLRREARSIDGYTNFVRFIYNKHDYFVDMNRYTILPNESIDHFDRIEKICL